ncbi:MAG: MerR family transcriptional regulator, partial [Corynebacterium sp.]
MSAADSSAAAVRRTSPKAKKAKTMSIGVVLETLNQQFPDVTVSKIRFLESEGLISPQRTASGYRRFTQEDVDRLRYILTTQRDNYTPLKVIRE